MADAPMWEPAAIDREGEIRSLESVLRSEYGLSMEEAGHLILQREHDQFVFLSGRGVNPVGYARWRDNAFRLYRLREPERRFMLPLLDRLQTDELGRRLPPKVEATGWAENRSGKLLSEEIGAAGPVQDATIEPPPPDVTSRPLTGEDLGLGSFNDRPWAPPSRPEEVIAPPGGRVFIDPDSEARVELPPVDRRQSDAREAGYRQTLATVRRHRTALEREAAAILATAEADSDQAAAFYELVAQIEADIAQEQDLIDLIAAVGGAAPEVQRALPTSGRLQQGGTRFSNLPMTELAEGEYHLDREFGLIKFPRPRGHMRLIPNVEHVEEEILRPAEIRVTCATELRPDPQAEAGTPGWLAPARYSYMAVYAAGKAQRVDEITGAAAHATPVDLPEMVLLVRLDGTDNREDLDAAAQKICESQLGLPEELRGSHDVIPSFFPVNCNGLVSRVTWSTDGQVGWTEVDATQRRGTGGVTSEQLRRILNDSPGAKPVGWVVPGPGGLVASARREEPRPPTFAVRMR